MRILIENVWILTMNSEYTEYKNGYLIIENQTILSLGDMNRCPDVQVDRIIDGHGGLLMPGMINTHTHAGMIPFRSLGDDTPDRLTRFLFPLESQAMTAELAYHSTKVAIAEMQLAGITTFYDMYYFEESVAEATAEMNSRAILAETVLEDGCDSDEKFGGLKIAEEFIKKWSHHPLITPAIAPHAPYTNSTESLKEAVNLSTQYGVPLSIHLSEMMFEIEKYAQEYQQTPVEYLEAIDFLSNKLLAAHLIFATDDDLDILAKYNVSVAHCIGANTKSAKGVAPLQQMIDKGLKVGLGTDGPSSGNTLDLFTQMKLLANFHKTYTHNRAAFPSREIVRLATLGGAEALGMEKLTGSLEIGKKADITLIETESINMFPIHDPYAAIVYSANAANVCEVWIDGKHIVSQKRLKTHSEVTLTKNLSEAMTFFKQKAETILQNMD